MEDLEQEMTEAHLGGKMVEVLNFSEEEVTETEMVTVEEIMAMDLGMDPTGREDGKDCCFLSAHNTPTNKLYLPFILIGMLFMQSGKK